MDTDTLHTDTTLDIDDTQAIVSVCKIPSAHSRLGSVFGYFAERAFPTGCEPNVQFEDLTSRNFASIQGDSGMNSVSSSSGAWTGVAATTIPGTESVDLVPRDRLRQRDHGHRFSPREGWSLNEKHIARNIRRYYKQKSHEALHQQRTFHDEQLLQQQRDSQRNLLAEASMLASQSSRS